jgi:hypothetical protein
MVLSLSNIINISITQAARGLSDINTSALALITDDDPIPNNYGEHRIYYNPVEVAQDFGTDSVTARLANMIFGQQKNILTGGGYLVVIPRIGDNPAQPATVLASGVDLSALPANGGGLVINVNGTTQPMVYDNIDLTDIGTVQSSLNSIASEKGLTFELNGTLSNALVKLKTEATGASATLSVLPESTLTDLAPLLGINGQNATGTAEGEESVKDAILRTIGSAQYFGIICTNIFTDNTLLEIASTVQPLQRIFFAASPAPAVIDGIFKQVTDAGLSHTRCLFYSRSNAQALDFAAGYASVGLSCNFAGSNTVFTMHLKEIAGLIADTIDQTTLQNCKNNGIDTYSDFGVPKVFTSGINMYYDQVYNRLTLEVRMQIALFNFLAITDTKIPQTEQGLNALIGAARNVLQVFVVNGMLAPGKWNSPTTFGKPEDHIRNIKDFGFYIYSQSIAAQPQTERESRKAPLIQIAAKEAGAIHGADLIINMEA